MPEESSQPLVSCIMPTADRRHCVAQAIRLFQAQDYPNKELVVVDDGVDAIEDLIPAGNSQIRYIRLAGTRTLGAKRNQCVMESRADLIMHWDDDDWMAPHRISYQVESMVRLKAEVCGLPRVLYYDLTTDQAWLYEYPANDRPWLAGNTLLYTKEFWRRCPFPDIQVASDTHFVWSQPLNRAAFLQDYTFYVAMIHPGNVSPKHIHDIYWTPWSGDIKKIVGDDLEQYRSLSPERGKKRFFRVSNKALTSSSSVPILNAPVSCCSHTGQPLLRIAYILSNFPKLSETFIRREILALCKMGHRVFVYAQTLHQDPCVDMPHTENLVVRQVDYQADLFELLECARFDGIEHIHGSLMLHAQQAAHAAAQALQVPFTITAYSGYSVFTASDPHTYGAISKSPMCGGIIVEDLFMRDYFTSKLGVDLEKLVVIPNSFDLERFKITESRPSRSRIRILAISRFVEKKGLVYLIEAFQQLCSRLSNVELYIAGGGPEEDRLLQASAGNSAIRFMGLLTEEGCRKAYIDADILCIPCVRAADGDADGVPTVVLEAMAMELPVVSSDLLSMSHYVRHGKEGLLAPPGDSAAIAASLERLCLDWNLRQKMGRRGRQRVKKLCDLNRNSKRLSELFVQIRLNRWHENLKASIESRKKYSVDTLSHYDQKRKTTMDFFRPAGRFLDIGCGQGDVRSHLGKQVSYFGCDPVLPEKVGKGFAFAAACGEALPYRSNCFDGVLLYATLIMALSVDAVLDEAVRVLKTGGFLYLRECVNDPNPAHNNNLSDADLLERLKSRFKVISGYSDGPRIGVITCQKMETAFPSRLTEHQPREIAVPGSGTALPMTDTPLVSIAITTYNRAGYIKQCLESALGQSYSRIEVIVVDDGSTDETCQVLETYRGRVKIIRHDHNLGIAAAKNRALRAASANARYVAILDSDDLYHPNFVERCVAFLEANPDVGFVYTDDVLLDSYGMPLRRCHRVDPWDVDQWLLTRNLRGDTWLARRDLVMQTDLHDESMPLDVDYNLFFQLLERTTFAHLPEPLVFFREHYGQSSLNHLIMARCHAANLVRYGYSEKYAYRRAQNNPEWHAAVAEGIRLGRELRAQRKQSHGKLEAPEGATTRCDTIQKMNLAVNGGTPVRSTFLTFGMPCLGEEEINEVVATLKSGWIGMGPRVEQFEEAFAAYVGTPHAVALNSCTAGLFLSLLCMGIQPGDEVITTSMTFAATLNVIEHIGARPVLADIDPRTFNIDPVRVESAITHRTKAIMPVHFGGLPCDMASLRKVADRHGLFIIEDSAHAIGARYQGRMVGSLGNLTCFSFYANKNLTTAEGGMVTTTDPLLAGNFRLLRMHGLDQDAWKRFGPQSTAIQQVQLPGYKFNMTDLAAAIGMPQLRKQEAFLKIREEYACQYDQAFAELPVFLQTRPTDIEQNRHSLHLYLLMLDEKNWRVSRDQVVRALRRENIGATIHYPPIHTQPYYHAKYRFAVQDVPNADRAGRNLLTLPLSPAMSDSDVRDVISAVHKVAEAYAVAQGCAA